MNFKPMAVKQKRQLTRALDAFFCYAMLILGAGHCFVGQYGKAACFFLMYLIVDNAKAVTFKIIRKEDDDGKS